MSRPENQFGTFDAIFPCKYSGEDKIYIQFTVSTLECSGSEIVLIDEKSSFRQSTKAVYDELPKLKLNLENSSLKLNWNPLENPAIRGTINSRSPSEFLEDISDIVYQFDISITCIFHYLEALDLKEPKTYENLVSSFTISSEFSEQVNRFLIKNQSLIS